VCKLTIKKWYRTSFEIIIDDWSYISTVLYRYRISSILMADT